MKKILFFTLFFTILVSMTSVSAKTFDSKITNNSNKEWTIAFNSKIAFNEATKNFIYIVTDSGEQHPTTLKISDDAKKVTIHPEAPFLLGESYSVVITKDVQTETGKYLKEETRMPFSVQGKYIVSVKAILNPLVTNVVIQGTKEVAKMSISVNGNSEIFLHNNGNGQYTRGMLGLMDGDEIHIRAYTEESSLLEEQMFKISN